MRSPIFLVTLAVLGWTTLGFGQGRDTSVGIGSSLTAGGTAIGNASNRLSAGNTTGAGADPAAAAGLGDRTTAVQAGGGFLGRVEDARGGFLGAAGNTATNTNNRAGGQFGNFGGGQFGNFGGGRGGQFGQFGQPQQQRPQRIIRTRITVPRDFAAPIVPAPQIQSTLKGQFDRLGQFETVARVKQGASRAFWNSSVTVITNGQTVILRGRVSSDRDRKLAEKMAKFEPGVAQVVNELIVADPS